MAEISRKRASLSRSLPNALRARTGRERRAISSCSAFQSKYVTCSTGRGAAPPIAALDHDASRNSWFVSMRSAVRERMRSSSMKITWVPWGMRSRIVSKSSVRSGMSDSIPSTIMPCAILSRISNALGYWLVNFSALSRIASVRSNSRHGKIASFPTTGSLVR